MGNIVDWSKPIKLRGGDVVRLVGDIDGIDGRNKAVAIKRTQGSGIGKEFVRDYPEDGMYFASKQPDELDIINVPPETIRVDLKAAGQTEGTVYERADGTTVLAVYIPTIAGHVHIGNAVIKHRCIVKLPDSIELEVIR
jgi:hypothetical protein